MAQWLKQSTATTVKLGPFLDSTDGFTAKTALSIAQADIRLTKNGNGFAQTHNSAGAPHDENGYYGVPLDTTDTDTLGRLKVAIYKTGALPVWQDFVVVAANVFDSLIGGGDVLNSNASKIGGITQTGRDLGTSVLVGDKTGFSLTSGEHTNIASDTQTGLTAQGYTTTRAGYIDVLNTLSATVWNSLTATMSTSGSIGKLLKDNVDVLNTLSTTVWNALTSTMATSGSIGKLLKDNIDAAISSRNSTAPDNASISSIKTQTDKLNFTGTDVKATLDSEKVDLVDSPNATARTAFVTSITSAVIEGSVTLQQAVRAILDAAIANVTVSGTTVTLKSLDGGTDRAVATIGSDDSRTVTSTNL